jgi:transcription initiation factor TFIIA small subunit
MSYELYRRCSLGIALTDSLDEMIQEGTLDPQSALKILSQAIPFMLKKKSHLTF